MKRVASLYLPEWAIERHRRRNAPTAPPPEQQVTVVMPVRGDGWRPGARWARGKAVPPNKADSPRVEGEPLVLSHKIGSRVEIASVAPAARALGIVAGMALTQARACVPGLVIRQAESDHDRADLERLAVALARRWSPVVAISDDDGLFIDFSGVAHLHGGEARMVARLVRLLARFGVTARVAVADTAGAAWALARFAGNGIHPTGAHGAAITLLPVAALRIDDRAVELLNRLGIDTIGALAKIPRGPLVRRFGKGIALRLDQATGHASEPLDPVAVSERIVVTQHFAEPIATPEAIEHWLGQLVARLVEELTKNGLGARALLLVGERVDNEAQTIRVGFARPTRDPAHIARLLIRRIEEIAPGYGIDALHLDVRRADPLGPQAVAADLASDTAPELGALIDTLANRTGAHRLWREASVESDVPERSTRRVAPLDLPRRSLQKPKADAVEQLNLVGKMLPWDVRWPRPVRLLSRPERVDGVIALMPDNPPRRFTWRGSAHRVICADGPERIYGEWWKRDAERDSVRDYFRVEDEEGRRYWLFRRGDGERSVTGDLHWYLHGVFG